MSLDNPTPRCPGGKPGNQNAHIHGFHSTRYRPAEVEELAGVDVAQTIQQSTDLIRATSLAATALKRLVRTQPLLDPDHHPMFKALAVALKEIQR